MNREELLHAMDEELRYGRGMEGVLNKVLGEVLGIPTCVDNEKALDECERNPNRKYQQGGDLHVYEAMRQIIALRRAHYSKVKTAEERVTLVGVAGTYPAGNSLTNVFLDGKHVISLSRAEDAEIYRLGLIAKLKEGK